MNVGERQETLRFPADNDWNLVILPWALENWLAINQLNVSKPESVRIGAKILAVCEVMLSRWMQGLKLYEYVLPNPRLRESELPSRSQSGRRTTSSKMWRVYCVLEQQVLHFDVCGRYLYDQAMSTQPSSNCLLFGKESPNCNIAGKSSPRYPRRSCLQLFGLSPREGVSCEAVSWGRQGNGCTDRRFGGHQAVANLLALPFVAQARPRSPRL